MCKFGDNCWKIHATNMQWNEDCNIIENIYIDIIKEDELYIKDFNLDSTFDKNIKYNYFVHKNMEKEKCQIKDIIVSSSFDKNLNYDYVNDKNYDNEIGIGF